MLVQAPDARLCNVRRPAVALRSSEQCPTTGSLHFSVRLARAWASIGSDPSPRWLPSNEHWYSGLLPYRFLLPAQLLFLAIMIAVTLAVYQDEPFLATGGWNRAAPILLVISGVYFVSMALRYVLTMALRPERRWFKRTIPIWFHMVLAIALWAFADYLR